MTAPFLFPPLFRQFDDAGLPAAGYLLFTYAAGTTTPKTTYSDAAGTVPNANPVVLDSTGSATVRLGSGGYNFVLKDPTGVTTKWSEDQYQSSYLTQSDVVTLLGADPIIRRTAAEIAGGVTPSNYAYPPGDVRRYGATLDGTTNDVAALNAVIAIANATTSFTAYIVGPMSIGANATIPATLTVAFLFSGALIITGANVVTYNGIIQASPISIFQGTGTVSCSGKQRVFYFEWWGAKGDQTTDDYTAMNNCLTSITASAQPTVVLLASYRFNFSLSIPPDIELVGFGKDFGTQLLPAGAANITFGASAFRNAIRRTVINLSLCTAANGIVLSGTCYNITFEDVFVYGVNTLGGNTCGINIGACQNVVLQRVTVYGSGGAGHQGIIITTGAFNVVLNNCDIESCFDNIQVTGTAQCAIVDCYIERHSGHGIVLARTGAGNCVVRGGEILNPNAGTVAISLNNGVSDCTIDGVDMVLSGGSGINALGTATRVNVTNIPIANITDASRVLLIENAGLFSGTAVFAAATTSVVTFAVSAANASYKIALGQSATSPLPPWYTAKTAAGFTINFSANFTGNVDWTATL